jgi:hypothetical protein
MTVANRIEQHAAGVREIIAAGGKDGCLSTPEALVDFDSTLDLDFEEHYTYQNAQAHAHAAGRLSTEEAQTVYWALGEGMSAENGGWQPHVDTALKVTVTSLMAELLLPGRSVA